MRKFLIAIATAFVIFGGQAEAVEILDAQVEMQDMGKWAHFRDKYILNRETENERRQREAWERRHRDDYHHRSRDHRHYRDNYHYDPPPHYRYAPPPRYRSNYPAPQPRRYEDESPRPSRR